jgi:hypothetical protein
MDDGADKALRLVERDQCRARALASNALSGNGSDAYPAAARKAKIFQL